MRIRKYKRRQIFKKILSITIAMCILGMIATFPMIWWFFKLETIATKYFLTFMILAIINIIIFEKMERR